MNKTLLIAPILLMASIAFADVASDRAADSIAVWEVKAQNANTTLDWDNTAKMDTWYGVAVDDATGRVTSLSLSGSGLTTLPTEIGSLTALTSLDISSNQLTSLPTEIGSLTALTDLYLYSNKLTSLPDAIGNLTGVSNFQVQGNLLTSLPSSISKLTLLTELDVYDNQLASLPASIGDMTNLTTLPLYSNKLTSLPDAIGNLTGVSNFQVQNNLLTSLPSSISKLTLLTELDVYDNQLTSLPASVGEMTGLEYLGIYNNKLKSLPDTIGNLTNVFEIDAWDNQLESLPAAIVKMSSLTDLEIGNNKFESLPAIIGSLTNLNYLSLDSSNFESLPGFIGNLTNLNVLILNDNNLASLPDSITKLVNLGYLDIFNNKLTTLPASIADMINLNHIDASNNHLDTLPAALYGQNFMNHVSYLKVSNNYLSTEDTTVLHSLGTNSTYILTPQNTRTPLTIVSPIADKVYNHNDSAVITGTLTGVANTDTVKVSCLGSFASTHVGTGIAISTDPTRCTLYGAQAYAYTLTLPTLTANITKAPLTIIDAKADKVYDGTAAATITGATLAGKYGNDAVDFTLGTATFNTKDAGTAKPITVTGSALSGADTANYSFTELSGLTANITPKTIHIQAITDTIVKGASVPTLAYLADTTLFSGDTYTGELTVALGNTAGHYAILLGTLSAGGNYTLDFTSADLVVNAEVVRTITAVQPSFTGSTKATIFNLQGKQVWAGSLNIQNNHVTMPNIGAGQWIVKLAKGNTLKLEQN